MRILVFEDTEPEGAALVEELRRGAPEHGFGSELEILWFRGPPRMKGWRKRPQAGSARPTLSRLGAESHKQVDTRLPIYVREDDPAPRLFGIEGERELPHPADRIWWPADFHAALVDRFHEVTGRDLGGVFLNWLDGVRFNGPVAVVTRHDTPPSTPPHLKDLTNESKRIRGWENRSAAGTLARLAQRRRDDRPFVGARGHDPTDFDVLQRFFDMRRDEPAPVEWKSLWLGTDDSARKALYRFFPSLSVVEPDTDWAVPWGQPFPSLEGMEREPLAVVQRWLEVLDAVSGHTDFPQLLWIDLGEGSHMDGTFVSGLIGGLSVFAEREGSSFLTVVLADQWNRTTEQEMELLRHGVVVEHRHLLLGAPGVWLEGVMDGLSDAWNGFARTKGSSLTRSDYVRFIGYYFRALLVAHTRARLVGPAEWFTSYPADSSVTTTLVRQLKQKVWKRMPRDTVAPRLGPHFVGAHRR